MPFGEYCDSLFIKKVTKDLIGTYINNNKRINIIGYESPICLTFTHTYENKVKYNSKTKSLYVRENETVEMNCNAHVWANECLNKSFRTNINNINTLEDNSNVSRECVKDSCKNMNKTEVSNKFIKKFSRTEKKLNCSFYDNEKTIETLELTLFVEYGPEYEFFANDFLNQTIIYGSELNLSCPIIGYPIRYTWFNTNNKTNILSHLKSYSTPKTLNIGSYEFECQGKIVNDKLESYASIRFSVNVVAQKLVEIESKTLFMFIKKFNF